MSDAPLLPAGFEDLAPFVDWCGARERERVEKREASDMDEIRAFYDAVFPRLEAIVAHLDKLGLDALPAPSARLLAMSLSLVEVSNLVERYHRREAIRAVDPLAYRTAQ